MEKIYSTAGILAFFISVPVAFIISRVAISVKIIVELGSFLL